MKTKIVNSEKPDITDSDILQTKPSFNSLFTKFISVSPKVFFSNSFYYWVSGAAVVTATAILLVINANNGNDQQKLTADSNPDTLKNKYFVEAPVKSAALEYKEYKLESGKASEITTCRGSRISVPEDAFVYDDGSSVEGEVTLKYREFNNPVEVFQSGIPMQYDSAKTDYVFESAGMIELLAEKDNKQLSLAKGKAIDVELKSDNNEDRFNVYYLDTIKKNWVYQGRDICKNSPVVNEKNTDARPVEANDSKISDNIAAVKQDTVVLVKTNKEIIKPVLASRTKPLFKVDYNTKDFPELSAYQNLLFEVSDNSTAFNKEWYTVNWDKISLQRTKTKDLYLISLRKKDSLVEFTALPVFNKDQYDDAMKIFAQNQNPVQKTNVQHTVSNVSATTLTSSLASGLGNKNSTTRSFKVVDMGIWNCDHPVPFSNFQTIADASFKDANSGAAIDCKATYVATLSANILLRWNGMQLAYSKSYENLCFVVTYDEQIGIINPTEFKNAVSGGRHSFPVKIFSPVEGIKELNNWITADI